MNIIIYNIKGVSFLTFDLEKYTVKQHSDLVYSIVNTETEKEIFVSSLHITSIGIEEKI